MSTTILSFQNRVVIETLHNEGRSLRYIANYLGFSKTTIFNELHRLNSEYQAELAQTDFERKVSQRGRKSSLIKNLKHLIEEKSGLKSIFETDFKRHSEPRLPSTAQINH